MLSVSLWDVRVFVYIMCMHATVVYIYLCNCIEIFKFEAHLNMIIVPASVWGYVAGRALQSWEDDDDSGSASASVGSVQCQCRLQPGGKLRWAVT